MQCVRKYFNRKYLRWVTVLGILIPVSLLASSITISWQPNTEPDLAGYKIYYGTESKVYSVILNVKNVTSYEIQNLTPGMTYYFALTAYDNSDNESELSQEVVYKVEDDEPPVIGSVTCLGVDHVRVVFNESVEKVSAELEKNYTINNNITVQNAVLDSNLCTVDLYTTLHSNGNYTMIVNNIRDRADVPNTIKSNTQVSYSWNGNDEIPPRVENVELYNESFLVITFSEPLNQLSALQITNYSISPSVNIRSSGIESSLKTVYLTTASHTPGQSYTLTINNVKDGAGNVIASNTQKSYQWVSKDLIPPTVIAVRLLSATQLQLEFSEPLDATSATKVSNYTISPSVSITKAELNTNKTVVTLTTSAHQEGTYTITVKGVGDSATPPNTIASDEKQYMYILPDKSPPLIVCVELTSPDLLQITFNERISITSAENVGNYSISPAIAISNANLDVHQEVVLLRTAPHAPGKYRLTVNNIKDQAEPPNTIASNTYADYSYESTDVYPPELLHVEMHGSDMVELVFNEPLDRNSSENVKNFQITPFVVIKEASLVGDSLNHIYLKTDNHTPGQSYTITIQGIMDRATTPNTITPGTKMTYNYPLMDNTPPSFISAELQGNKSVKLIFSEALEQTSAENESNYSISPAVTVEEATLDISGTKVFLKTGEHQAGKKYTLTVVNVKDKAQPANGIGTNNMQSYMCESVDVIPPHLLRADLHGDQTLELIFDEPLDKISALVKSNYSINNGISIKGVSLSQEQMEVFLETTPHEGGTYTVTVNGVKDMASNPNVILPNSQATYTYTPVDVTPPVLISVTLLNKTTIELLFDEKLDRSSAVNSNNYSVNNGVSVEGAILDFSLKRVYLTTSDHVPNNYTITINGVKDASGMGNTITPNTIGQYAYVINDKTPPYIVSAVLETDEILKVSFSEALNQESVENMANYAINNNIEIKDVFLASTDQVILGTSPHSAGEYILTVNGIQDASESKNQISPYSQIKYTWSPVDTIGPSLISATLHANNYLEIGFSEPVDGVESEKIANYTITPSVQIQKAVLGASLDKVWLFTDPHTKGTYKVTVKNVKDRAFKPNPMGSKNQIEYTYVPPDTSAPNLVSVRLRTHLSLEIVFDEDISRASAENIANYTITPKIEVKRADLLASRTTVLLETSSHQKETNYTIQISGIEDRAPIPNKLSKSISAEYTYMPPDTTPPKLLSVTPQGTNLLELIFDEALEKTSAQNRNNYKIDPYVEVLDASLDESSAKKVFLQTTDHFPGVAYTMRVENVKDRAPIPNVIVPKYFPYSMPGSGGQADNTPPQVAKVDIVSSTKLEIVFTERVDSVSAQNKSNYIIDKNITIESAKLDSNLFRVRLTTSTHEMDKSYTIRAKNIKDLSNQSNVMTASNPVTYFMTSRAFFCNLKPDAYQWHLFHVNDSSYVDRNYTVVQIPKGLENSVQIRTANGDKTSTDASLIAFELKGEATVFVGYDKRISQLPEWLSSWKPTGDQIVDSRSSIFQVYSTSMKSGKVVLGGNHGTEDDNMYLVFVVPQISSMAVLTNLRVASSRSYQLEHISVGDTCYIDRPYTIASIPESLEELLWVQTANDDKEETREDFLHFTLNSESNVYVAYDARITSLPNWLKEWKSFQGQIGDSRSTKYNIWVKKYQEGEVILGGNCGSIDDNMYFVLIEPTDTGHNPEDNVPGYFTLKQNYPNPFNPETTIQYVVQKSGHITLTVYNILGQQVKLLVDEFKEKRENPYSVIWKGTNEMGLPVASGMYFYRIQQGNFAKTRRMLLLR